MAKYVRNTLLPDLYATYLEENNDLGIDHDLTLEEFCKMVGLTTMSPKTAWRWMKNIFEYKYEEKL